MRRMGLARVEPSDRSWPPSDRVTTERRRQKMCAQHLARACDGGDHRDDLLDLDFRRDLASFLTGPRAPSDECSNSNSTECDAARRRT